MVWLAGRSAISQYYITEFRGDEIIESLFAVATEIVGGTMLTTLARGGMLDWLYYFRLLHSLQNCSVIPFRLK